MDLTRCNLGAFKNAKTPELLVAKDGTICREGCPVILQKLTLPRHLRICFLLKI